MLKTYAFELWCWRRLLRISWTAGRLNQSILKESVLNIHWKGWCSSLNSSTLAIWCEEDSLEKTVMVGKIEGGRRRGRQRMRWLDGITDVMDMSLSRLWELVMDREAWHVVLHGVVKSRTQLSNRTGLRPQIKCPLSSWFSIWLHTSQDVFPKLSSLPARLL